MYKNEFSTPELFLSAANCDIHGQMSMAQLETRLIVTATLHANQLNIGYADLVAHRAAWVLSRMSIEVERMPGINSTYRVVTWIESFQRYLSERNFAVIDCADGSVMAYARSVWAMIDIDTRRPVQAVAPVVEYGTRECPIPKMPRMGSLSAEANVLPVNLVYSDFDFNGHVNSARYLEHIIDSLGVECMRRSQVKRLDISYLHEVTPEDVGRTVLTLEEPEANTVDAAISVGKTLCCRARLLLN